MSDMASKYRALGDKAKAMMFDESFQQYFYDAAKEFVRLTAELEHHKGKAEVWEDAARAAQAKVEALEADRDKRVDKWMQLIVGKDERIERLEVVAIHAQAKIKALEGVVDAVMAYDSNLIDTLTRARITMPQSSRVSE